MNPGMDKNMATMTEYSVKEHIPYPIIQERACALFSVSHDTKEITERGLKSCKCLFCLVE